MSERPLFRHRALGSSLRRGVCTGAVAVLMATPAYAQIDSEVVVSASAGYDSNPFLAFGGDRDVASFRLELVPTISRSDEISSIRVSGRVEHVEYARLYDSAQNLSANVDATYRINERLDVAARVQIASTISTTDFTRPVEAGGDGDGLPPPIDDDITLLGDRQRRNTASAQASLHYIASEFDDIRWTALVQTQRYPSSNNLEDSDYASQQIAYTRRLNEDITLGGVLAGSISNFRNGRAGDAKMISPQLSFGIRLAPRFEVSGSAGLSFTRTKLAQGTSSSTTFAGNLSLCYKVTLDNFCLTGSRQVLPSAIGGVREQSSIGASYSRRLSERDTIQLGGSYATASSPLTGIGGDFESVRGYARYDRQLTEKLTLFASAGYSDSSDDLGGKRSNVQGVIGISYRFGGVR